MGYDVQIAPRVLHEDLPGLPGEVIDDLYGDPEDPDDGGKIGVLAQDPTIGRPLSGSLKGLWRLPLCGRYRAVYSIFVKEKIVGILMVGIRREASRNDVYRRLSALLEKVTAEALFKLPSDPTEAAEGRVPKPSRSRR